jgi:hypothetical protein
MGTAYNEGQGSRVIGSGTTLERTRRPDVSDAEVATLDGITSTVDELNILDGVTSTAAELNILDGVTSTAAELNILDGVTATAAELNYNDLATLGTAAASKVLSLDASGDGIMPTGTTLTLQSGSTIDIAGTFNIGAAAVTATAAEINKLDDSVEDVYADGIGLLRIAKATYDFSVDGGTIGAIDLGVTIPANSIILGGLVDVVTTCTTASADAGTGALSVESADDIVAAVAVSAAADWDQGLRPIVPTGVASTAVKTTAAANITFTIAVQDFTAGKFHVILYYVPTVVNT